MKLACSLEEAAGRWPRCAVAVGNFDGVHLGHRSLIAQARALAAPRGARAIVLTFRPHPAKVLSPQLAPPLIATPGRKLALLAAAGAEGVVEQPFDRAYAATTAEEFAARDLLGRLGVEDVVVGPDFTFGKGRAGNPEALARLLAGRATVHVAPPVKVDDLQVSSSKIRELVLTGRVSAAAGLLGHPFVVDGHVVPGRGRGRTIGVPTANVALETELVPASGVYVVQVVSPRLPGVAAGAANIGVKPTFGGGELTIEVHLLDVAADLYGEPVAMAFLERLRGEEKFADVPALVAQIRRDIERARQLAAAPADPLLVLAAPGEPCAGSSG